MEPSERKSAYRYLCPEGHLIIANGPRTTCSLERNGQRVCWGPLRPEDQATQAAER